MQCVLAIASCIGTLMDSQLELRLVVCGSLGAGKTSLIRRLAGRLFSVDTVPTNKSRRVRFMVGDLVMKCCDLGGQRRFEKLWFDELVKLCKLSAEDQASLALVYVIDYSDYIVRNSHAELVVAFNHCRKVLKQLVLLSHQLKISILVVGNKTDLAVDRVGIMRDNATFSKDQPLLSKHTVRHATSRKHTALLLPSQVSLSDFARDLDIVTNEETQEMFLRFSRIDFSEDESFFTLFKQLGLFGESHEWMSMDDLPKDYSMDVPLDRDFGIMLTSCNTGEGIEDVIHWLVQGG